MAKAKNVPDEFSNIVYVTVDESAANTLTFQQIQTGYGSLQKTAWILHRIEYYLDIGEIQQIVANDDAIRLGISTSDLLSDLDLADAALVDLLEITLDQKSAVGFEKLFQPIARNFTDLPGGGRLVLPYPLYMGVMGVSLGAAMSASARLFFTEREMKDNEWMELVQQTRLLS